MEAAFKCFEHFCKSLTLRFDEIVCYEDIPVLALEELE